MDRRKFKKMMGVIAEAVEKAVEEATERRNAGGPDNSFPSI
tara:strand:- start:437 stop:559 length:123 start_codon:yes stop_codon:yes gene_type:complete